MYTHLLLEVERVMKQETSASSSSTCLIVIKSKSAADHWETALKPLWNRLETALESLAPGKTENRHPDRWSLRNRFGTALEPHWNCFETALEPLWNRFETALEPLWNRFETAGSGNDGKSSPWSPCEPLRHGCVWGSWRILGSCLGIS